MALDPRTDLLILCIHIEKYKLNLQVEDSCEKNKTYLYRRQPEFTQKT